MSYQPDSSHQPEANAPQFEERPPAQQQFQHPFDSSTPAQGQRMPATNPYIKYTLFDGIVGFIGALIVLSTQSLAGTFFIFLCAAIALYRGTRAMIFVNRSPATSGRATGIVSIILGGLSIIIMIYLLVTVGVQ